MFAMLDPNRSPTARSGASASTALTSVSSSGIEVAPASSSVPTKARLSPVRSAIWSPADARATAARTRRTPPPANTKSHCHAGSSGITVDAG